VRKVTSAFGLRSSFLDSEFELLFDENNELRLAVIKHVDDLKICGPKDLIEKFVAHVSKAFGKLDIEWYNFTFCGAGTRKKKILSLIRSSSFQPSKKCKYLKLFPKLISHCLSTCSDSS
jgi:hypothetical protein